MRLWTACGAATAEVLGLHQESEPVQRLNPELREIAIRAARARLFFIDYIRLVHGWEPPVHQLPWVAALQALADRRLLHPKASEGCSACSAVAACSPEHSTNLLHILAPPGSGKTDTVKEWLEWLIGRLKEEEVDPLVGYVCNAESLALKRSIAVRNVIEFNGTYRLLFPSAKPDKATGWEKGSWFLRRDAPGEKDATFSAVGFNGEILGNRWTHAAVIDDPNKGSDLGLTTLEGIYDTFRRDVMTRIARGRTPVVLIDTRLHTADLAGRLLEEDEDWHVLHTKALKDDETTYWEPAQWHGKDMGISTEDLLKMQDREPDVFLTQYQCLPPSEGGGVWQLVMEGPRPSPSEVEGVYQFWDTALTARETSTYNAMVEIWKLPNMRYFVNRVINQKAWPEQMHKLIADAYWQANEIFPQRVHAHIENKAGAQETKLAMQKDYGVHLRQLDIPNKDLTARSAHAQRFFHTGSVFVPEGWEPWKKAYVEQLRSFPNGRYTDMVSATILACEKLFPMHLGRPQATFSLVRVA